MNVANKTDEVADLRIKHAETWRRICLRVRRIGKVTDCLQTDHCGDLVAAFLASAGINQAAHFTRQEIRRLLIYERNEAQRVLRFCAGEPPSERKRCSHAGAVIVCAGRAKY